MKQKKKQKCIIFLSLFAYLNGVFKQQRCKKLLYFGE